MTEPYNCLTPAQAERLAMLAEEASEVVKACMKILRHSTSAMDHCADPPVEYNNSANLEQEIGELFGLASYMVDKGDLSLTHIEAVADVAMAKKIPYMHHHSQ